MKDWWMTFEAIRARAPREHWRKQLDNDGKDLISVSVDAEGIPSGDSDGDAPASRPVKRSQLNPVITVLQTITSDLELRAVELSAPVERERSERLQERGSGDRLTNEIAALASQFANTVDEAAVRERDLQGQLGRAKEAAAASSARTDAMKTEMEASRPQPW